MFCAATSFALLIEVTEPAVMLRVEPCNHGLELVLMTVACVPDVETVPEPDAPVMPYP